MSAKALCLLDGGYISVASVVLASQQFDEVHAITCKQGHQTQIELESAVSIANMLKLVSHKIVDLSLISTRTAPVISNYFETQGSSASKQLKSDKPVFPSAESILLLTLAANQAAEKGIKDIFLSLCKDDCVDGFARCQDFIDILSGVLGEGLWRDSSAIAIHMPLLHFSKAASIQLAMDALGDRFQKVFELTHNCDAGIEGGCGQCDSCMERDRDFLAIGAEDPIWKFRHPEFDRPTTQVQNILP